MTSPEPVQTTDPERSLSLLSVVAPMYQEAELAPEFCRRVFGALEGIPVELVLVDDGSTDATWSVLENLAAGDARIKVISLSRNFGHQIALTAGLDAAQGDAIVMLDSDLQDPPELIPELLARWREGSDVVYAVRSTREGETRFKLLSARLFYRIINRLSPLELPENAGDFRLLDRRALDALGTMRERSRYLRGMTAWIGFTQSAVHYERDARAAGETRYTLARMIRLSFDAISSFSHVPLQLATLLGFLVSAFAFLAVPLVVIARITHMYVPGISSLLLAILLLGGIQLLSLGLIGEYLGRIYDEVKGRPLYLVRGTHNLGIPATAPLTPVLDLAATGEAAAQVQPRPARIDVEP